MGACLRGNGSSTDYADYTARPGPQPKRSLPNPSVRWWPFREIACNGCAAYLETAHPRHGFAARCEAVALPRRPVAVSRLGYALGSGSARNDAVLLRPHGRFMCGSPHHRIERTTPKSQPARGEARTRGEAQVLAAVGRRGRATASHRAAKPLRKNLAQKTRSRRFVTQMTN